MAISPLFYLLPLVFVSSARPLVSVSSTNNSCSFNSTSSNPCKAYISYRAQKSDSLGKISDLFGVSRLTIAEASNLVSEDAILQLNQLLLIPLPCACTGGKYLANVTYGIQKGDSFYWLSSTVFQNLTNWHVITEINPHLNPNLLRIGIKVTIPLFCKCPPGSTDYDEGIQYLITYVWQPNDEVSAVAHKFGAMESDIYRENNGLRSFDEAAVGMPILIPVSELPTLWQSNNLNAANTSSTSITNTNYQRVIIIIVCSVGGGIIFVLALVVIAFKVYFSRSLIPMKMKHSNTIQFSLSYNAMILRCKGLPMETIDSIQQKGFPVKEDKLLHGVSDYLSNPIAYDSGAIMAATLNLSEKFRIQGSVFKAVIDEKVLAVKRMKNDEVSEELEILQRVNHANLVKLVGVASDITNTSEYGPFFVFEYAENGFLEKLLFSSRLGSVMLTWRQRVQIALDVANGLQYLHEHSQPSICHGDIRCSNILVDERLKAKLSNFSMARSASILPALLKADVFGFGVVLLELLSGQKGARETILTEEDEKRKERLRDWMDPNLRGIYNMEEALILANLARVCTLDDSCARPSMAEIVFNLSVVAQSAAEIDKLGDVIQVSNLVVAR